VIRWMLFISLCPTQAYEYTNAIEMEVTADGRTVARMPKLRRF